MQLAMHGPTAVRHRDDVGVVQRVAGAALDEAGANGDPMIARELEQLPCRWSVRYGLGERLDLLSREMSHVPVTRQTHLGKRDDFDARLRRGRHEMPDAPEIVC